ncbi:MAG: hypothetical protein PHU62_06780 [Bacteroidales bacterium]|nr:hypothetical protein [Bacteroidales bacterium]MDD2204962.1 hypothetical protein [Bacteroidales bacterium]MDD3152544.1 hypothetical protein [Bacteroidales bacterium]MDD3913903.1 hypothetical protein [Bacteroidales bacterium]MDD4634257.1 hypothetical protein [Bacteroidales bacterium]
MSNENIKKTNVKAINSNDIEDILRKYDQRIIFEETNIKPDKSDLNDALQDYIKSRDIGNKSVLGIDIYRYSSYSEFSQTLIPFLFKKLFDYTITLCLRNHPYVFQEYSEERINRNFISSGDGGYVLFDTPFHSLIFAFNLAFVLRIFNSFHLFPKLRRIIGEISMRYTITYDKIYFFENNFYGKGIIHNARIIQKDNLNRCLIDQNTYLWFMLNIDGVENLQLLTLMDISNIYYFKNKYEKFNDERFHDEIFSIIPLRTYGVINADLLQIGCIASKETVINIYNLHIQVVMKFRNDDAPDQSKLITITLGNINTEGI